MRQRLVFLGVTWVAAYLVVMALFLVFGGWLQKLPTAARAAVISVWMVIWMTQLVIPLIQRTLQRVHLSNDRSAEPRHAAPVD